MRFLKAHAAPFSVLLGIGLAIAVPLLLVFCTDDSSSSREVTYTIILAFSMASGVSILLIILYHFIAKIIPNLTKRVMIWITFKSVSKAVVAQTRTVQATGITEFGDDVGVGLPLGRVDGVIPGHPFVMLNAANQEELGTLEAYDVRDSYCVCSVFDRINPEFWAELERRMRHDPSPPQGVTIRRELPEESLLDWLEILLKTWRD